MKEFVINNPKYSVTFGSIRHRNTYECTKDISHSCEYNDMKHYIIKSHDITKFEVTNEFGDRIHVNMDKYKHLEAYNDIVKYRLFYILAILEYRPDDVLRAISHYVYGNGYLTNNEDTYLHLLIRYNNRGNCLLSIVKLLHEKLNIPKESMFLYYMSWFNMPDTTIYLMDNNYKRYMKYIITDTNYTGILRESTLRVVQYCVDRLLELDKNGDAEYMIARKEFTKSLIDIITWDDTYRIGVDYINYVFKLIDVSYYPRLLPKMTGVFYSNPDKWLDIIKQCDDLSGFESSYIVYKMIPIDIMKYIVGKIGILVNNPIDTVNKRTVLHDITNYMATGNMGFSRSGKYDLDIVELIELTLNNMMND